MYTHISNTVNVLKFKHFILPKILFPEHLFLRIFGEWQKSVDPGEEQSDLGLHCLLVSFCQKSCIKFRTVGV